MGKYLSVVIGVIVAVTGLVLLLAWRSDLLTILKGSIPLVLVFGGAIAFLAGLSELKDEAAAKKDK